jgi:uncharacterized protein (UPF0548 family)
MWQFNKPSDEQVKAFLTAQAGLDVSYRDVGASAEGSPAGYNLDHNRTLLGTGPEVFERACGAIRHWCMFPARWTEIRPERAPQQVGTVVAMMAHVFGLWWLNACRIVYVIDEAVPIRRFGFAYGTLPAHVESGEERFSVEWHADDRVWYDLRAFSRPRYWLVRAGYPLARRIQRRFVVTSQAAMRQAVANPSFIGARQDIR